MLVVICQAFLCQPPAGLVGVPGRVLLLPVLLWTLLRSRKHQEEKGEACRPSVGRTVHSGRCGPEFLICAVLGGRGSPERTSCGAKAHVAAHFMSSFRMLLINRMLSEISS